MKYPSIGTVSEGTMRPEDLIPEFMAVIERYAPERYEAILESDDYPQALEDGDYPDYEGACQFLESLFDAMNEIGAPYTYFGASEGDGADYGYWPSIESLEEDTHYVNGAIKVNAGDDWGYADGRIAINGEPHGLGGGESIGYVMSVSDHGNVTLYDAKTREEIWSIA